MTLFFIATPLAFILVIITWGKATNFIVEHFARFIGRSSLRIMGIRFNVKHHHSQPYQKPAVYTINHSSTLDILTLLAIGLPRVRFVAKWELQYFPFFFIIGRLTGQVFIKRQNREHAVGQLMNTYNRLTRNQLSIMVAPEGSRKHPGIIGPFKKGAFRLAIDLGYPIVPIYFEGNSELSYEGSLIANHGTVTAHVHPPVETSSWKQESIHIHVKEVRSLYLDWAGVPQEN
ncbi:MAG: lysophospholipid acyltransferase family protein [Bacteroidota bacterium]